MSRINRWMVVPALAVLAAPDPVSAQDNSAGWTGITDPSAVVLARQSLMAEAERLMRPIDSYTVGEAVEPEAIRSAAATLEAVLLATPHLFPPTTDLYDEAADIPVTIAMPAIWQDFAMFTALAEAAVSAAGTLSSANDAASLETGAIGMRGACDACHALYMLPYEPPSITDDDLNFDFEGFFDEIE